MMIRTLKTCKQNMARPVCIQAGASSTRLSTRPSYVEHRHINTDIGYEGAIKRIMAFYVVWLEYMIMTYGRD